MSVETGVNICSTQLNLPTIFDILASDDLDTVLKPSFSYVLKLISQCKPAFQQLSNYQHQLYLVVKTLVELYTLKTADASLSEYFYGLQRCPAEASSNFWRLKSIFFLIYVPIIRDKLNSYYEELKVIGRENLEQKGSFVSICNQQFMAWYPMALGLARICNIIFVIGYITGRTSYATLNLFLQRIKLVVSGTVQLSTQAFPQYSRLRRWSWRLIQLVVFFLQFHDWWSTNGENSSLSTNFLVSGFRKVKPPTSANSIGQAPMITHGLCPICEEERQVPAVIASTGILGCYECLRKYIQDNKCCPVTGCPTKIDDVMRLFLS